MLACDRRKGKHFQQEAPPYKQAGCPMPEAAVKAQASELGGPRFLLVGARPAAWIPLPLETPPRDPSLLHVTHLRRVSQNGILRRYLKRISVLATSGRFLGRGCRTARKLRPVNRSPTHGSTHQHQTRPVDFSCACTCNHRRQGIASIFYGTRGGLRLSPIAGAGTTRGYRVYTTLVRL